MAFTMRLSAATAKAAGVARSPATKLVAWKLGRARTAAMLRPPGMSGPVIADRRLRMPPASASDSDSAPVVDPGAGGFLASRESQARAFDLAIFVYGTVSAVTTFAPAWVATVALQHPSTPSLAFLIGMYGACTWLAVAAAVCLKDAVLHSRLESDTYIRLNLALLYSAIVSVAMQVKYRAASNPALISFTVALALPTAVFAAREYALGAHGFDIRKILKGMLTGLASLFQPKTLASAAYGFLVAISFLRFFILVPAGHLPILVHPGAPDPYAAELALGLAGGTAGAGFLLNGIVFFVLKDAADRGRLSSSTFRTLNLAAVFTGALQLWHLVQAYTAGVPFIPRFYQVVAGASAVIILLCSFQYFAHPRKAAA